MKPIVHDDMYLYYYVHVLYIIGSQRFEYSIAFHAARAIVAIKML